MADDESKGAAPSRRRRRNVVGAALAAVVLTLSGAACSGGSAAGAGPAATSATSEPPSRAAALTEAALAYNQAMIDPAASNEDAAVIHDLLVADCQSEMDVDDVDAYLVDAVEERRITMDAVADQLRVGELSTEDVGSITGTVLVRYVTSDDPDPMGWGAPMQQTWYLEDDAWRIDLCNDAITISGTTEAYLPVRVLGSGMHQIEGDEDGRFATNWAVVVANPNHDGIGYDVVVTVAFFDAEGKKVGTDEGSIIDIEPGDIGAAADIADARGAVRMEATARVGSWMPSDGLDYTFTGVVESRSYRSDPIPNSPEETVLEGTVTSNAPVELGAVPVIVFFDSTARVVGGTSHTFVDEGFTTPGGTTPFTGNFIAPIPDDWETRVYVTPVAPDHTDYSAYLDE